MTGFATSSSHAPIANTPLFLVRCPSRLRQWALGALGVAALLGVTWLVVVPPVVESVLMSRLRGLGFDDVRFGAIHVALDEVTLRNLRLGTEGEGDVLIPTVTARFRAGELLHGHIDELVLVEPVWTMAPAPGSAASPFDELRALLRNERQLAAPEAAARAVPVLPIGRVEIRRGRIVAAGRAVDDARFDVSFTAGETRWTLRSHVTAAGRDIHVNSDLQVGEPVAAGTIEVHLGGAAPLVLQGTCRVAATEGERVLDVDLTRGRGRFDVAFGSASWSGDGVVALRAHVPFDHLDAAAFAAELDVAELASSRGLQIDGLVGTFACSGLPEPISNGPQTLRWHGIRFGTMRVGNGELELDLRHARDLHAKLQQRTADGTGSIAIAGVRLSPASPETTATLHFDEVPLQEWLEVLSRGRVTGDGRLTGSVDVAVQLSPRFDFELLDGRVSAVRGGTLRFLRDSETRDLIRQHTQHIAASTGHGTVVQERIVEALEEFAYSALDFRIERDPGSEQVTLRVHTAGTGRKVAQQLELDVNLHGLDTAIDTALAIKLGLDRAKRRLDDKVDGKQVDKPEGKLSNGEPTDGRSLGQR